MTTPEPTKEQAANRARERVLDAWCGCATTPEHDWHEQESAGLLDAAIRDAAKRGRVEAFQEAYEIADRVGLDYSDIRGYIRKKLEAEEEAPTGGPQKEVR